MKIASQMTLLLAPIGVFAAMFWSTEPLASSARIRGRMPVVSMLEMRQAQVVKQGWDLTCGAAALSTILSHQFNDPIGELEIVQSLLQKTTPEKVKKRKGFSLLDLKRFSVSRGYLAEGYGELEVADLLKLAPAIVPIEAGQYNHFLVFRGIEDGHVIIVDPAFGNRTMTLSHFQELWSLRIAFVVRKAGQNIAAALKKGAYRASIVSRPVIRHRVTPMYR